MLPEKLVQYLLQSICSTHAGMKDCHAFRQYAECMLKFISEMQTSALCLAHPESKSARFVHSVKTAQIKVEPREILSASATGRLFHLPPNRHRGKGELDWNSRLAASRLMPAAAAASTNPVCSGAPFFSGIRRWIVSRTVPT